MMMHDAYVIFIIILVWLPNLDLVCFWLYFGLNQFLIHFELTWFLLLSSGYVGQKVTWFNQRFVAWGVWFKMYIVYMICVRSHFGSNPSSPFWLKPESTLKYGIGSPQCAPTPTWSVSNSTVLAESRPTGGLDEHTVQNDIVCSDDGGPSWCANCTKQIATTQPNGLEEDANK